MFFVGDGVVDLKSQMVLAALTTVFSLDSPDSPDPPASPDSPDPLSDSLQCNIPNLPY